MAGRIWRQLGVCIVSGPLQEMILLPGKGLILNGRAHLEADWKVHRQRSAARDVYASQQGTDPE